MNTQEFKSNFSWSGLEAEIKKLEEMIGNIHADADEEVCPFTLEPLAICSVRKADEVEKTCPYSLESCMKPDC